MLTTVASLLPLSSTIALTICHKPTAFFRVILLVSVVPDEYTPNTITYKFPNIVREEIIIAPHTLYTAESDLRDAIARPLDFVITDTPYCKFVKSDAYIYSGWFDKLGEEFELSPIVNMIRGTDAPTVSFVTDKEAEQIKKNVNRSIREGYALTNDDFHGQ